MASKKVETVKFSSSTVVPTTKGVLTSEEAELFELAMLAGVEMEPKVFKILVDLLQMNVAPVAIERMLRSMASSASSLSAPKRQSTSGGQSMSSSAAGGQSASMSSSTVTDSRVLSETSASSSVKPRGTSSLGANLPPSSVRK